MRIGKFILNYNTPELTQKLCQMVPGSIIIDNGSSNTFPEIQNRIIRYDDNLGFTRNWNRVIKHLWEEFDVFWLMNSDIIIQSSSRDRILELMNTGKYPILTPSYNCWMKQCQNQGTMDVREIKCIELTAPLIKKSVFQRIGFFNEKFNLGSGVDFDFCLRLQTAGLKVFCDDGSNFEHLKHSTIKKIGTIESYSVQANKEMNEGMQKIYGPKWKDLVANKLDINKKIKYMSKIAVYTTIFGDYDQLQPVPKQSVKADYYCITDNQKAIMKLYKGDPSCEDWQVIQVEQPRKDLHPRMRAKWFKIFPWECEKLLSYEKIIFFDGDLKINSPDFIEYCIQSMKNDILLFRHPYRNCIYDEKKASEDMVKYQNENMEAQVNYYKRFHPEKFGLWACTVIVRRPTFRIKALMMSWWHENIKFTWQDQLSFPVVCRIHNIFPEVFPDLLYQNRFFKMQSHANKGDQALIHIDFESRNDVINYLIRELGYRTYLEIGHRKGESFYPIEIESKESVDPQTINGFTPTYLMKSDEFFKTITGTDKKFDIIFIDGDHDAGQVLKDIKNALKCISANGCIITHDTNPPNERFVEKDRCFTAFRALVDIAFSKAKISVYTLKLPKDEGNGISILFPGEKTTRVHLNPEGYKRCLEFDGFNERRSELINTISFGQLEEVIKNKKSGKK
jgi:hypothetical protein